MERGGFQCAYVHGMGSFGDPLSVWPSTRVSNAPFLTRDGLFERPPLRSNTATVRGYSSLARGISLEAVLSGSPEDFQRCRCF